MGAASGEEAVNAVFGVRCSVLGISLVAGHLLVAAASAQTPDDRYRRFSAAFASLDAGIIASMYTEDALYMGPGGDIIRGRAAIGERFEEGFRPVREHKHIRSITFDVVDRTDAATVRADVGYYTITTVAPDRKVERFRGKFSKVWRRDADGVWRIHSDSYSQAPAAG